MDDRVSMRRCGCRQFFVVIDGEDIGRMDGYDEDGQPADSYALVAYWDVYAFQAVPRHEVVALGRFPTVTAACEELVRLHDQRLRLTRGCG